MRVAWVGVVCLATVALGAPELENLARGKPYTLQPPPSYALCTDPGDATQLTDGVYTQGHFWTQKTTVGWTGITAKTVTIDLQRDEPIRGVAWNTAGGIADVKWPARILVLVSADGKTWYEVGDLVALSARHDPIPEYGAYHVQKLWTDQLRTHGRYVALQAEPGGIFLFCDEVEVYRGDAAWVAEPYRGTAIGDPVAWQKQRAQQELMRQQYRRDLKPAVDALAGLPEAKRAPLAAQAAELTKEVEGPLPPLPADFRAVLPMTELERRIFRFQAAVWRAQGKPAVRVWTNPRWDPLDPSEEPADGVARELDVHVLNGETRAATLNVTNAGEADLNATVTVRGLPLSAQPYLTVHEVQCVATRRFRAVSAALPEAQRAGDRWRITVPAGMTRQVWLSFHPETLAAGVHQGTVEVNGETLLGGSLVRLHVYPVRFPDRTTVLLGGWDYTDTDAMYGITRGNKAAVVADLKAHFVNTPWATGGTLGDGSWSADGKPLKAPDTASFDRWVKLWPEAKRYMVFKAVGDSFDGAKLGTPEFAAKVGAWATFWANHAAGAGVGGKLGILLVDEPSSKAQFDVIVAWAKAIKPTAPELLLFEDPQPADVREAEPMLSAIDIICPYRRMFVEGSDAYRAAFLEQQKQGRTLWLYNADGPARSFDPFSFYLVQFWHCFELGATGSMFWAFGDNGGVSCWNELPAEGNGPYCPSYLDPTSVTAAKYLEAIREGVEDYELLTMLRERIAAAEKRGAASPHVVAARNLLDGACARVLAGEQGANYRWDETKDRTVADRVRVEVLNALVTLDKG